MKHKYEVLEISERPPANQRIAPPCIHFDLVTKLLLAYPEKKGVTVKLENGVKARNFTSGVGRHVQVRAKEMQEQFRLRSLTMEGGKMFLWLERVK